MEDRCAGCRQPFALGDVVQTFYLQEVRYGEKSGQLGFYDHPSSPGDSVDHMHYWHGCAELYFQPENGWLYDIIVDKIRREVTEDIRDEIYEEFRLEYEDMPPEPREPPMCLWCKSPRAVWKHEELDKDIFNCLACQKLWDHNEDELLWDPQRGYVVAQ